VPAENNKRRKEAKTKGRNNVSTINCIGRKMASVNNERYKKVGAPYICGHKKGSPGELNQVQN